MNRKKYQFHEGQIRLIAKINFITHKIKKKSVMKNYHLTTVKSRFTAKKNSVKVQVQ